MTKPLNERLLIPHEREGLDPLEVEGGRYTFFKTLFGKSGKMAKINLYAILLALPAIAWFLYSYFLRKTFDMAIDYSGNLGLGYAMVENAVEAGKFALFYAALQHYLILAPAIIIAFIGLGGAFFAMRKLAQGDERIAKNYFKGIKLTFADFFLHGILASFAIFIFAISFTIFDAYGLHIVWKIFGIIFSSLLLLAVICYLIYACTISTFYKTSLKTIIKNSVLLATRLPIQSILLSILGAAPIAVMTYALPGLFLNAGDFFATLLTTIGVALFFFLGISLVIAAWTVYTDHIYVLLFHSKTTITVPEQKNKK